MRHVAQEMDTGVSTVAYAYPNVGELLDELTLEHGRHSWAVAYDGIGDRGLRAELLEMFSRFFVHGLHDPVRVTLLRWEVKSLAEQGSDFLERFEAGIGLPPMVTTIRERAGETYRVPDHVVRDMLRCFSEGALLYWVQDQDYGKYWANMLAGIEAVVLLADPRPIGEGHPVPVQDFSGAPLPDPAGVPVLFNIYEGQR